MTYADVAQLAADPDFVKRVAACHASVTPIGRPEVSSEAWAGQHAWQLASRAGLGDAYAVAVQANGQNPGKDPDAVTDEMILNGVQILVAAESS